MKYDLILVGGGLSSGLIAAKLRQARPEVRYLIIEQGERLGGEHTWSFHSADLTESQFEWVRPLITKSWPSYRALFPEYSRTLSGGYHSVTSAHFHAVLLERIKDHVRLKTRVTQVDAQGVTLEDGTRLEATGVVDARGFDGKSNLVAGYQKFLGLDVVLATPHGEVDPILMDGRTEQKEGLRFFYTLPWDGCRIQVGEARYTESPHVPREEFRAAIREYAQKQGWEILSVEREGWAFYPRHSRAY